MKNHYKREIVISLPNFLIIGSQKCGTTFLINLLNAHPQIKVLNEINFFNNENNYRKGIEWYKKKFGYEIKKKNLIIGEKTAAYTRASIRIKKALPDIQIIWIFRNPINRTYSHYWHGIKWGEEILTFEKALIKERVRIKNRKLLYPKYHYISASIYNKEVEEFLKLFNQKQFLYLTFEELIEKPTDIINRVYQFLNVEYPFSPPLEVKKNITEVPANNNANYILGSIYSKLLKYGLVVFSQIILIFMNLNIKISKKKRYPRMSLKTREVLKKNFKPYNSKLEELTKININNWN